MLDANNKQHIKQEKNHEFINGPRNSEVTITVQNKQHHTLLKRKSMFGSPTCQSSKHP